jgi:hypothetical protein
MRYKLITLILFIVFKLNAQTEGISYQAIIIGSTDKELPGINASNNLLVSSSVSFEFTIVDEDDNPLYRETQSTQTDSKGLVHLIIGSGSPSVGLFNQIMWDGTLKNLIVEIDLKGGTDFSFLSQQSFLYLPYEYHRDITASGNVDIDGDFNVDGLTQFNDDVMLDGDSYVGGLLTVDGGTILNIITPSARSNNNKALTVNGYSLINGNFEVANSSITSLTGKLTVDGITDLNNTLNVDGETTLNETFTVTSSSTSFLTGDLNVDGTTQLNEILNVTGNTGLASNLTVTGTTELNNTLNVAGNTGLASNLTVTGITQLNNTLSVASNAGISSNLSVSGATLLNSSLTVANSSPSILTGSLRVDGVATLNSLGVTNNLNLSGNLIVNGTTQLNNTLNIASNTGLAANLTVTGTTQLNDVLNVTGNTGLAANLTVTGTTQLNNTLNVTGQVGIGTTTPEASSILDVSSTTKGLLAPRMTEIQKNAISSPAEGLLLYQTDQVKGLYVYNNPNWKWIFSSVNSSTHVDSNNTIAIGGVVSAINSVAIGVNSLVSNTTGTENTAYGYESLSANTIGNKNTANGYQALTSNIDGDYNTAVGYLALRSNINGFYNTAIGNRALFYNIGGGDNTAVGHEALISNVSGGGNTANGGLALRSNQTGDFNVAIGYMALMNNVSSNNTALGGKSLKLNTGSGNTAVGFNAGDVNTSGSNNTLIGYDADVSSNNLTNATAIGYNAAVDASNKIQLGDTNITNVGTSGSITAGAITIPNIDGTANQVLKTDGLGTLSWTTPSSGVTDVTDEFISTTSQTSFTLTQTPPSNSKVKMFINGVRISNAAYSWSGTTLTYVPVNNSSYSLSSTDRVQFDYFY